ncbi:succinate dehydrogenase assembly factor 2 [Agaribacter marinus]|uniref:FAD assembly factor SdhE n=1 Tax=Agaribacter marinus TaxID=1431249 RepID=A0AA37WJ97_9ALTE|nr:succinate dehydrogenase assembly factor 2 [Agaribacter marinus]GLR73036.1 hypothetical protein GCM10007852_39440 [Agaribacter marinus]
MTSVVEFESKRLARLKWACRRGMLELDVLLLPFVEQAFDQLSYDDKVVFERLLTADDPDLFAWFMGHQECKDKEFASMIARVLTSVKIR